MDNVERLMEFGLTRHEASLYILLTLEGSLNGYEAAKQSGRYSSLHTGSDRRILQ